MHLLLLANIFIFPVLCTFDTNLVEDYLKEKSIRSATIFGCFSKNERLRLARKFMFQSYQLSILNIHRDGIEENVKTSRRQIGVILDGDCRRSENFLITCGRLKLFSVKHHWLIMSNSAQTIQQLAKVDLNIDCDVHVALRNVSNDKWTIIDVYNPASDFGGALNHKKIGHYDRKQGYRARGAAPKYLQRKNMTGVTFTSMIVLLEPFEGGLEDYLDSEENKTVNTFDRFQHALIRSCRNYYNFTLIIEAGSSWGYPYPNGSMDGMVGALERKLIHFGSSCIFLRENRIEIIDFGRNTWRWQAGFLFRRPKSKTTFRSFLKPLSTSSWIITVTLAMISIMILKTVTTYERNKYRNDNETSWSLSVIFVLGALCQQGTPSVPRMTCGRITTLSVFLLSLLIYQFYSASIVSNLLMKPENKIKTVKDLLESSLEIGCEDVIYSRYLFTHTTDKILKEFYRRKIHGKGNASHFWDTEKGLNLVKQGGYAFHAEAARAYPIIEATFPDQAICELREVKMFAFTDLYSAYQKDSPFYDMMETCFQRLAEHGIIFNEIRHWHPRKPGCTNTASMSFHVGLDEFYPALLVLLIGISVSLIVLIVEKHVQVVGARRGQVLGAGEEKCIYPFTD